MSQVAIVGLGHSVFDSSTPTRSFKEMMFEAATRAYADANIDPRTDAKSFICCTEDFWEGYSISDEYMPDQLGAVLRPLCTVSADGLFGICTAYMHIKTGMADVVVVESHSKASDVLSKTEIEEFALDPVFLRPLGLPPLALAGLEMRSFLHTSGIKEVQCAEVVVKNRRNALLNPHAVYGTRVDVHDVLSSGYRFAPLKRMEVSRHTDGSIVLVLASETKARKLTDRPVWIRGVGWATESSWIENRDLAVAGYAEIASRKAYKIGRIEDPSKQIDLAEIDDTFSYKELQHLEALRLVEETKSGKATERGFTARDGQLPVNVSGGSLGFGHMLEATGLHKVFEAALQLRGEAGRHQIDGVKTALVQSWRGVPTSSGAVVVLGS